MQPQDISCWLSFKTNQQLWCQVSCCLSVETTQQLWRWLTHISCCFPSKTTQQLWWQHTPVTLFSWLLSLSKQTSACRVQGLRRPLSPCCTTGSPSLLLHLIIPKHSFTSAKVLQYFVGEIERTGTMEMILKTMKPSFGRSQIYHRLLVDLLALLATLASLAS